MQHQLTKIFRKPPTYVVLNLICIILFFPLNVAYAHSIVVKITGLNSEIEDKILPLLAVQQAKNEKDITESRAYALYQQSLAEIELGIQALGYYHATIDSKLNQNQDNTQFIAQYDIHLGSAIIVRSVNLRLEGPGQNEPILLEQLKRFPLSNGSRLDHAAYDQFKQNLLSEVLQYGYLDAVFVTNYIRVDPLADQADICLVLQTGNRYKFGPIDFMDPPYPVSYLHKYVPFEVDEPYTTQQLIYFQRVLTQSDLFSKVLIEPIIQSTNDRTIPIKVHLKPKPHNRYTASVGYGSDTGLRSMAGWERKCTDYPGHRIQINGKVSEKRNHANFEYSLPGPKPITDTIRLTARVVEEKFNKKYSLRSKVGSTYNMNLFPKIEQILSLHYLSELDRILPTAPKKQTHFLMPSLGYVWSDMHMTPSLLPYGTRVSITLRGSLDLLLSSTHFLQTDYRMKWIYPLGDKSRFIFRNDFGVVTAGNHNEIPLSLRYFTGGDQTIRGYGYRSLGPTVIDAYGEPIVVGGKYLLVTSLELDRLVYKNISLAVFVDTGNAMNKLGARLATGTGIGVRWGTPLGPLRLDLAQGLNNKKFSPRVHITFGMDF